MEERKNPKIRNPKGKQEIAYPPWIDLPKDLTANILHRLGAIEILGSAQKVCTTWRSVCKDPSMWRVIDMKNPVHLKGKGYNFKMVCTQAVARSCGGLIDINIEYFGSDDMLNFISEQASNLKRLSLAFCDEIPANLQNEFIDPEEEEDEEGALVRMVKKYPQLEELHLIMTKGVGAKEIRTFGESCPMLKSFTFNKVWSVSSLNDEYTGNVEALVIATYMTNLRHLKLIASEMTNMGLQLILDGCPHLESLDLRRCLNLDLGGDLGKRCSEQIKCLRRPNDSTDDYEFYAEDGRPPKHPLPVDEDWFVQSFYYNDN